MYTGGRFRHRVAKPLSLSLLRGLTASFSASLERALVLFFGCCVSGVEVIIFLGAAKAKRRKKKRRKITAGQAPMDMYFQPRHTWRRSVEVSSDESGSEGEEHSARDNTDPSADGRVQQAIGRMPDCGVARREARARSRQARAMTANRREVHSRDDGRRRRAGGWRAAGRKRRRVISDSDSDSDDEGRKR